jgi:exosortase
VGIAAAYWDVGAGLVRQWATDDNYSHGFLVAPLAAYFAWQQRTILATLPVRPSRWGAAGLLLAAILFVTGRLGAELFLTRLSLLVLIAAAIAFLFGRAHVRALRFPLLFLLLMVPLPAVVFNQLALPLQLLASQVGEVVLRTAGVPVLRDGNVLELETLRLEVADACSGIRSIISLLAFALVLGRFGGGSTGRLWLLALATVPIAIAANAARVAVTGLAAHAWGSGVAAGTFHATAGALVFLIAAVAIFLVHRASGTRRLVTS